MWQSQNEILYKKSIELEKAMSQLKVSETTIPRQGEADTSNKQSNLSKPNNNTTRVNHPLT